MKRVGVLMFPDFETLDVFGPVEILGILKENYQIYFYSQNGGLVTNNHGVTVATKPIGEISSGVDLFLIPGGYGTREEVNNEMFIDTIRKISEKSGYVLTVCTGSALLAKTGLLNGKTATTNRRAFDWVVTQGTLVNWDKKARWTVDGKYYTSAGVSAGMDMILGFLSDIHGVEFARDAALRIEYEWKENSIY